MITLHKVILYTPAPHIVVTFKPDQKEKELSAKSVGG